MAQTAGKGIFELRDDCTHTADGDYTSMAAGPDDHPFAYSDKYSDGKFEYR